MKKFLLLASAAIFALASCEKVEPETPDKPIEPVEPEVPEVVDEISVDPTQDEVVEVAKTLQVLVSSTGDWTLAPAEEYDWVTASADKGVDSDVVNFTVAENYDVDRTAVFTFTCGKAEAKYTIVNKAGVKKLPKINILNNESEVFVISEAYAEANVLVEIAAENILPDAFTVNIKEGADWLKVFVKQQKPQGQPGDTQIYFSSINANDTGAERTATVEISANGYETLVLTIKQNRLETITLDHTSDKAEAAGKFTVKVTSTSDWTLEAADTYTWVTPSKTNGKNGDTVEFNVTEFTEGATATFTFKIGNITTNYTILCQSSSASLKQIEVVINSDIAYYQDAPSTLRVKAEGVTAQMYTCTFVEPCDWLSTPYLWDENGMTEIYMSAQENKTGAERIAKLKVEAPGCETITIDIKQLAN